MSESTRVTEIYRQNDVDGVLRESYQLAMCSPDKSSQNGAIITQGGQHLSVGFNHFYRGVPPTNTRPEKYQRIVHAEADACLGLAKCSIPVTEESIMFAPWATCNQCAISLLGSGVGALVIHYERCLAYEQSRTDPMATDWKPCIDESAQWLRDGGCEIIVHKGPVDFKGTILVNGRPWSPKELRFVDEITKRVAQ